MADLGQILSDAPPVARTLAGATLILSFSSHVLNIISPMYLVYIPQLVFSTQRLQLWRLVTPFLLSAPRLGVLMDPFFLFKYASDCERLRLARKGDFVVFLLFVGSIITFLNTFVIQGMAFCSPLTLALAYYWAAHEDPSNRVNFFIATFPAKFLPWIMLLITLVQGGDVLLDLTGLVASHAYLFVTEIWPRFGGGSNLLKGPSDAMHRWLEGPERPGAPRPRDVPPTGPVRVGAAGTGATGVFGRTSASDGWRHRGQGHVLGS